MKLVRLVPLILAWLTFAAGSVSAEWFIDLYGGGAFLEGNDVTIKSDDISLGGVSPGDVGQRFSIRATLEDVEGDDFPFGGLRVGYWFDESIPYLGLGLDVMPFFFHTPAQRVRADSNATIEVEFDDDRFVIDAGENVPVQLPPIGEITGILSFDVMLRYFLLQNTAFPQGRLQPYLTAAPALLFTDEAPDVSLGVKVGAGLAWRLHQRFVLFTEYRFTHFSPTLELNSLRVNVEGVSIRARDPEMRTDLNLHYVIAGLSLRF